MAAIGSFLKHVFKRPAFNGVVSAHTAAMGSFYALSHPNIDGEDTSFEQFKGRAAVVVNVASS